MKLILSRLSKYRFLLGWGVSYLPFLIFSFWAVSPSYYAGYMLSITFFAALIIIGINKLLPKKMSLVVFVILCFIATLILNLILSHTSA